MTRPVQPAYLVDAQRWPLITVRATPAVHDERAALDETYRLLDRVLARREPFVGIFDLRGGASSPGRRRRLQNWREEQRDAIAQHLVAVAIVVRTSLERGFVTAALWLSEKEFPMRVFDEVGEAEAWLWVEYARAKQRGASAGPP